MQFSDFGELRNSSLKLLLMRKLELLSEAERGEELKLPIG
jgi:hypothetical protein